MNLRPFFCYYGGKFRAAPHYPTPQHETVVEPFAGAAGYATRYYNLDVRLYDANPTIAGLWEYLIRVKSSEIRRLPIGITHVDDAKKACQEAKWLLGFWMNKASTSPRLSGSTWYLEGSRPNSHWGEVIRERIATQVRLIRHWKVFCKTYDRIKFDKEATWFVDPPYQAACGTLYPKQVGDYSHLADWCRSRKGQTIVCEKDGATWLPFKFLAEIRSTSGWKGKTYAKEAVWINS